MVSPSIKELHDTIRRVRRRRNLILHTRQIGWCLASIVGLFIIFAFLEMTFHPAMPVRLLMFCLLGAATGAVGWQTIRTFKRLSRDDKRLAHYVDDRIPDLEQRLITSMDSYGKQGEQSPSGLVEALWQDTVAHVRDRNVEQVTTSQPAWVAAGTATVLICLLSVALWDSDRFFGAARRIIWPWSIPAGEMSLSAGFEVAPGDILIRRGSDVTVSAKIEHASPDNVFLFLRGPAGGWKRIRMQAEDAPPEYMHYLSGVQTDLTYYVDTGAKRSGQYRIRVFDLTRIESIDVDYAYPAHTGLENKTEKNGGDIIAPEGTRVRLNITFNRPVQKGVLKFDDGSTGDLTLAQNAATASFVVARDGTYVVDAFDDAGRKVENPLEYIIRAIADAPPEIFFSMPGRDIRVMALEEVSIAASAKDDFGLTKFDLNYSVAGNAAQRASLLETTRSQGPPAVDGKTTIYLEDLQVAPGDFVTYYLTAADNNGIGGPSEIISDIYFLEVIRTDQAFRRAAGQSGGGGGGQSGQGRSPSALVENQKNIIAATWKLLNRQNKMDPDKFTEEVNIVAASQQNLLQRTQMSLSRLVERFSFADESFDQAVIHMFEAVTHMQAASERLISSRLKEALGPEQAALQAILKAEAQSRRSEIQMARNRGGASGGDSQRREREDLRELFEMEMGRLENRYEMPAAAAGSAAAAQEDVLNQLRQLARRQERLNRAQVDADRRKNRMTEAQQKRQLEELRREQEDLRRQADALAQQLSRTGTNRSAQGALNQAIDRMRQATNNLERRNAGGAAANGREALQRLRDQEQLLQQRHTASLSDLVKALDEKADRLQSQENQILKQMEGLSAQKSRPDTRGENSSDPGDREKVAALIAQKDRLQDELKQTQETIWAIGSRGRQANPELARQAMEALRLLESEGIGRQVEETKAELKAGRLNLEKEKVIDRSISRFASRLRHFNPPDPKSRPERIEQAASSAAALSQALENLQREVEALRSGQNQSAQSSRSRGLSAPGRGRGQTADLNRLRDGLGRSQGHAQGLMQPWSQGEGWAADARSIYRELTRRQIEDFINQPDLWQSLLEPARELAARLSALAIANRLKDSPFSPTQQEPPDEYKSLVETYYKSLSEIAENRK